MCARGGARDWPIAQLQAATSATRVSGAGKWRPHKLTRAPAHFKPVACTGPRANTGRFAPSLRWIHVWVSRHPPKTGRRGGEQVAARVEQGREGGEAAARRAGEPAGAWVGRGSGVELQLLLSCVVDGPDLSPVCMAQPRVCDRPRYKLPFIFLETSPEDKTGALRLRVVTERAENAEKYAF